MRVSISNIHTQQPGWETKINKTRPSVTGHRLQEYSLLSVSIVLYRQLKRDGATSKKPFTLLMFNSCYFSHTSGICSISVPFRTVFMPIQSFTCASAILSCPPFCVCFCFFDECTTCSTLPEVHTHTLCPCHIPSTALSLTHSC